MVSKKLSAVHFEYKNKLNKLSLDEVKNILSEHDIWFLSWDEFPEERLSVKNSKEDIVNWIINTDSLIGENEIFDFLNKYLEDLN